MFALIRQDLDVQLAQQLRTRLALSAQRAQSLDDQNVCIDARLDKVRSDLLERCELRNNYYRRKLPLAFADLCTHKADRKRSQLAVKQHEHSAQFYKKVFHIQTPSNVEQYQEQWHQSSRLLDDLRTAVGQYESQIARCKQHLAEQTAQLDLHSDRLYQIQYEQQQLRSDIEQLKRQIRLEQQLASDRRPLSVEQALAEYEYLCAQITDINVDIERKSIDLSSLRTDLHVYQPILTAKANELIASKTRPLLVPITIQSDDIHQRSIVSKLNNKSGRQKGQPRKSKPIA